MAKKLMQFQLPEKVRQDIEAYSKDKDITLSELLRQSVRLYMIINEYSDMGYKLFLRKDGGEPEKEIILP
ncbi:MAG: hypothetical protein CVU71_05810 [Deltaproteobacteria bacterium HGW-Deltaproteobacteria-6]|jgi:hypothetical protein|nr:MAG: hypothetical protein CVU71_05810 [Deltaproteobacteria bacterium HGW-Deltaproteobacteria-6]